VNEDYRNASSNFDRSGIYAAISSHLLFKFILTLTVELSDLFAHLNPPYHRSQLFNISLRFVDVLLKATLVPKISQKVTLEL
jgi:hypothetical protein